MNDDGDENRYFYLLAGLCSQNLRKSINALSRFLFPLVMLIKFVSTLISNQKCIIQGVCLNLIKSHSAYFHPHSISQLSSLKLPINIFLI